MHKQDFAKFKLILQDRMVCHLISSIHDHVFILFYHILHLTLEFLEF